MKSKSIFTSFILFTISLYCTGNDSIPRIRNVFVNGGIQLNSYFSNSFKISNKPFTYSFGVGVIKEFDKNLLLSSSINYSELNYENMNHSVIDPYLNTKVNITATIKFKRLSFENELTYKYKKMLIGYKLGISVYTDASINENITVEDTSSNAINFYNKYIIYTQQEKSLFRLIVPHTGFTLGYQINRLFTLKYDLLIDVLKQPYSNFEFLHPFNPITQKLSLTFNIIRK